MADDEPRCVKTDMLVSGCDHCRPKAPPSPPALRDDEDRSIVATWNGWCPECHTPIIADEDRIVRNADDTRWIHRECA